MVWELITWSNEWSLCFHDYRDLSKTPPTIFSHRWPYYTATKALVSVQSGVTSKSSQCRAPSPGSVKSNSKTDIQRVPYRNTLSTPYTFFPYLKPTILFLFFSVFYLSSFDDTSVSSLPFSYRFFTFFACSLFLTRVAVPRGGNFSKSRLRNTLTSQGTKRNLSSSHFKTQHLYLRERGSVVIKAVYCKPEGRGFETRWDELIFVNLLNSSVRTRPRGLLSLFFMTLFY
jgi:hypothetical protein